MLYIWEEVCYCVQTFFFLNVHLGFLSLLFHFKSRYKCLYTVCFTAGTVLDIRTYIVGQKQSTLALTGINFSLQFQNLCAVISFLRVLVVFGILSTNKPIYVNYSWC